jgi:glyoxylase-like metal-dependent hydrolase (beta-lactamase superfamily II)
MSTDYSIWVLEYAHGVSPVSGVLYAEHNRGTVRMPYAYVVLKNSDRVVMIDVGYNYAKYGRTIADRFGVVDWRPPSIILPEVGVTPDDVTDVIVTHAHFDHFGNSEDFPRAVFFLQEREIGQWLWALTLPKQFLSLQSALDPDDIVAAARLAAGGRLRLVDGDVEDIVPGIDVHAAFDTHTFGSQFVTVKNHGGSDPWILAGDLRYVFENVTGVDGSGVYVPVGSATGSQLNLLQATEHMMQLVDRDERRIIPVHDDRLGQRFPSRKGSAGLTVTEITLAPGEPSRVA